MSINICAPPPSVVWLERLFCHTCERERRFIIAHYEWYGPTLTCLRCGENWNEDGRAERPFAPGWRKKSIRAAWNTSRRHLRAEALS